MNTFPKTIADWDGRDLKGEWVITLKLDGVRVHIQDGVPLSRDGKVLAGLIGHRHPDGVYEFYTNRGFNNTVGIARRQEGLLKDKVLHDQWFIDLLNPKDGVLLGSYTDLTNGQIKNALNNVVNLGFEGLVLRQGDTWLKVKQKLTYDVPVIDWVAGKGKNSDKMGALITPMGRVGTGFTDEQRVEFTHGEMLGTTIEVVCMELTKNGKFRHPRFRRRRFDK